MSRLRDPLWLARAIATAYALVFATILILEALFPHDERVEEGQEWEGLAVGLLGAVAVVSVLVAWRREGWTFPLMLTVAVAGALVGLITAGRNYWIAVLVGGGPYAVAAALAWIGRSDGGPAGSRGGPRRP